MSASISYIDVCLPQVMQLMSLWGPLIYAGCFAATLSTALTNLLSVPRLIQALGQDKIYPGLIYFSKGYGKSGEPYRGYVLTFLIAALFLLIGKIRVSAVQKTSVTGKENKKESKRFLSSLISHRGEALNRFFFQPISTQSRR